MIKLEIIDYNHQGLGIAKLDGKIFFVENAIIGEIVLVDIIKETKKYCIAKVTEYLKTSDKRVDYPCIYYDKCGGCNIGIFDYSNQLEFKRNKVSNIFRKYNKISINPIINKSSNVFSYRNKVVFHVKDGKIGFYEKNSNTLVEINNCLIVDDRINMVLKQLKLLDLTYVHQIMIRVTYKDIMLVILGKIDENSLIKSLNYITSIYVNDKLIYGKDKIVEKLGDYLFYISKDSFFQVNSKQAYNLYNKVLEYASLNKNSHVLDLYCGTGTIGIFLSKYCFDVIGIELNHSSVVDANLNKDLNNIKNIKFIEADSSYITNLDNDFDLVVVDPPRSGLDLKTINNLIERKVPKIIYISCDPMTLSRDLKILEDIYKIEAMELFDMFVNDYHVECVSVLSRKAQ